MRARQLLPRRGGAPGGAGDVTEGKSTGEPSRDSEQRFRLLIESLVDHAVVPLDPDGRVADWNAAAQRIKGYAADEVVGASFSRFYTEEDRLAELPARCLRTAAEAGRFEGEGWRLRKDGTRFWASTVINPIREQDGVLIGFASITRDISDRRDDQRKLEEAREQLFQAQKMEAIGQLTGGVAHDFNNLLTVILGSVDLAEGLAGGNEKLGRLLANMRRAAQRGESLTRQLLAFSRRQPLRPEPVDLHHHLRQLADLLGRSLRGDIAIETDLAADLPWTRVDPGQLELAFLNVGLNARDAMPEGGRLRISARPVVLDGSPGGLEGEYVAVALADTGNGMASEVIARAFEPFFTTKEVGGGSGLGLSQAYGFAKQSGGTLTLESEPGHGTTVCFYLPAAPERGPTVAPDQPPPRRSGSGTILLVEDEPSIAELAVALLEEAGYAVKVAAGAQQALAILDGDGVDLVFSDIMMPGEMNGADLARVVRARWPGIFVLLATGFAEAAASRAAQEFPLIHKPYGREALLDKLACILGDPE
jgi:PAS domain S-box-containing protein